MTRAGVPLLVLVAVAVLRRDVSMEHSDYAALVMGTFGVGGSAL